MCLDVVGDYARNDFDGQSHLQLTYAQRRMLKSCQRARGLQDYLLYSMVPLFALLQHVGQKLGGPPAAAGVSRADRHHADGAR